MAYVYIPESAIWVDKVRMLQTTDPVLGGKDGASNWATQDITNRTAWLKQEVDRFKSRIPAALKDQFLIGLEDGNYELIKAEVARSKLGLKTAAEADLTNVFGESKDKAASQYLVNLLNNSVTSLPKDLQESLGIYFDYDPERLYKPFERIRFSNGEWYQVYHPDGAKGKDPREIVNRPIGWDNPNVSQSYYWLKLDETGERGQIGQIVIAQSFQQKENWLPFVGGVFTAKGSLFPWLYRACFGSLPTNQDFNYGVRHNDFMRFIANENNRELLSTQDDAIRNIKGSLVNSLFYFPSYTLAGSMASGANYVGGVQQALNLLGGNDTATFRHAYIDASRVVPVANENRPVNTALTAFIII